MISFFVLSFGGATIGLPQESPIACTFFTMMWRTESSLSYNRVAVIIYIRRSIAHTREDAQDSDFFPKRLCPLVTAPQIRPSRQELLTLAN